MAESTTTTADPFAEGGWTIDLGQTIEPGEELPDMLSKVLTTKEAWDNYHNEACYDAEVRLRKWMQQMSGSAEWNRGANFRRYTMSEIFERIYNRPWTRQDMKYSNMLSKLFSYYSSRVVKEFYDRRLHKQRSKTGYTLSTKRLKRPPYSLKLRLEWLEEQGKPLCYQSMQPPKDDLKPGHARNPRTDANMMARSEEMRRRYYERVDGSDGA